jgi:uncharacterized protein (TIGR03435 family)
MVLIATGIVAVAVCPLMGQPSTMPSVQNQTAPAPSSLAFSVVSIRESNDESHPRQLIFDPNGDGLIASNVSLLSLIQYAFDIQSSKMISGASDWIKSGGYDVQAKVDDSDLAVYHKLNDTQRKLMLQTILQDRFKLIVHRVPMEISTFALFVAKNGPKMRETKPEDVHLGGPKKSDGTPFQGSACPYSGDHQLNCQATSMSTLAHMLSVVGGTGRQVVDKTGLTGTYDFMLKWTPGQEASILPDSGGQVGSEHPSDSAGISIFDAIQQLGLKLSPSKDSFDGLVVDQVKRPSSN